MHVLTIRTLVLLFAVATIAALFFKSDNHSSAMNLNPENNPLLAKWEGPYGGVPPFDRVQIPLFKPALEAAMAEQLAETKKIANDPAPPNFENTIAALERTGSSLDRVGTLYRSETTRRNSSHVALSR